jgi:hypothetical protein
VCMCAYKRVHAVKAIASQIVTQVHATSRCTQRAGARNEQVHATSRCTQQAGARNEQVVWVRKVMHAASGVLDRW